jgi:hypothetical protein
MRNRCDQEPNTLLRRCQVLDIFHCVLFITYEKQVWPGTEHSTSKVSGARYFPLCALLRTGVTSNSKIPWYPKLLFQRENALASFWVQRVLVTQPRPSQVMILFTLRYSRIENKPSASGLYWDTKTLSGVAKITSKTSANASGFDYILAPPSRVLVSQHRPSASGLIP